MHNSPIGRMLWRAVHDSLFRRAAMTDLGATLAESAFILTDREMSELRSFWDTVTPLSDRAALETIQRYARLHYSSPIEDGPERPARRARS